MRDLGLMTLENKRDAAVRRRTQLASDIASIEAGTKRSKPIWHGETEADAKENHLNLLRQMLVTEDQAILVMNEDLLRLRGEK